MKKDGVRILGLMAAGCLCMALVDGWIRPGYLWKSGIKIALFLLLPLLYRRWDPAFRPLSLFRTAGKHAALAATVGVGLYGLIVGGYFALRSVLDFSGVAGTLTAQTGVSGSNFLFVALYISFVNSLLEEYFFRGFGFLYLKTKIGRKMAYGAGAALFAGYHAAMMLGWYDLPTFALMLAGLFAGGLLFSFADEKTDSILLSWLIHMFANFAINTVGFLLFAGR